MNKWVDRNVEGWVDRDTGKMTCGCINHGVYTWEMPCPLWKEKIDDVVADWHEGEDVKQFGKHLTLPEYVYEILGVSDRKFEEWIFNPDCHSGFKEE